MDIDVEWQVPYHALIALSKLLRACPALTTEDGKVVWTNIIGLLLFPHSWVRTAACRLLGLLYAAIPSTAPAEDTPEDSPFSASNLEDVAKKLCLQLRSENLDNALSTQIVKNLFYIGKTLYLTAKDADVQEMEDGGGDDDEGDGKRKRKRNPLGWMFFMLGRQASFAIHEKRTSASVPVGPLHE